MLDCADGVGISDELGSEAVIVGEEVLCGAELKLSEDSTLVGEMLDNDDEDGNSDTVGSELVGMGERVSDGPVEFAEEAGAELVAISEKVLDVPVAIVEKIVSELVAMSDRVLDGAKLVLFKGTVLVVKELEYIDIVVISSEDMPEELANMLVLVICAESGTVEEDMAVNEECDMVGSCNDVAVS